MVNNRIIALFQRPVNNLRNSHKDMPILGDLQPFAYWPQSARAFAGVRSMALLTEWPKWLTSCWACMLEKLVTPVFCQMQEINQEKKQDCKCLVEDREANMLASKIVKICLNTFMIEILKNLKEVFQKARNLESSIFLDVILRNFCHI